MRSVLATLMSLVLAGSALGAEGERDWPAFRGPDGSGISPETGIGKSWNTEPPKLLWKIPMTDNGCSGPAAAEGKVFIVDHLGADDVVRAIDIKTGQDVWKFSYPQPGVDRYGYTKATPAYSAGKLYTVSQEGILNCLDAKTGKSLWTRHLVTDIGGLRPPNDYCASPLVDGDRLIVIPGGPQASVAALDKNTGQLIWATPGEVAGLSTPVKATINGIAQVVVFSCNHVSGYEWQTGKMLWSTVWTTDAGVNVATPLVVSNQVFVTSGYKVGCGLFAPQPDNTVTQVWRNQGLQSFFSSPIFSKGYVYGIGAPGTLVCIEFSTGKLMWSQSGFEMGPVTGVDDVVLAFAGSNGRLAMVKMDPGSCQELGSFTPLGGQSWTAPVIAEGKLIIRNKTFLACFALK